MSNARRMLFHFPIGFGAMSVFFLAAAENSVAAEKSASQSVSPEAAAAGIRQFFAKTAAADGAFRPGIDPDYRGMADTAYSDLAAPTYAVLLHRTFGRSLPDEAKTVAWFLSRQQKDGAFVNKVGTVDSRSDAGRLYNTTQGLVALHALGKEPKYDPLPVFEQILQRDYKKLPS